MIMKIAIIILVHDNNIHLECETPWNFEVQGNPPKKNLVMVPICGSEEILKKVFFFRAKKQHWYSWSWETTNDAFHISIAAGATEVE